MTRIHTQTPTEISSVSPDFSSAFLQSIPEDDEALSNEITRLAGHINGASFKKQETRNKAAQ